MQVAHSVFRKSMTLRTGISGEGEKGVDASLTRPCWCPGRADHHLGDGGPVQRAVPGPGAGHVAEASLPLPDASGPVVRRPSSEGKGAGVVVRGLPAARRRVAGRLLQPPVLPHCHHAAGITVTPDPSPSSLPSCSRYNCYS